MYVQAEARGKPRGVWERHSPHDVTVEERPWETGKSAPGSRGSHRQGSAQVPGRAPWVWEGLAKHHGAPLRPCPRCHGCWQADRQLGQCSDSVPLGVSEGPALWRGVTKGKREASGGSPRTANEGGPPPQAEARTAPEAQEALKELV